MRRYFWPLFLLALAGGCVGAGSTMIIMPGRSFSGTLPSLTQQQRELATELSHHVHALAGEIGERNVPNGGLTEAATYIEAELARAGYMPRRQSYDVRSVRCDNVEVELPGRSKQSAIVIIGAHYDSVFGTRGANDNGSGVAAALVLAKRFATSRPERTLRFVFFANEEPPYFQSAEMGSVVYADRSKQRGENIVAMLSLETIGYYSDVRGSQKYPAPLNVFYPNRGNFIGFVGNVASIALVRSTVGSFRRHARFPSEGAAMPAAIPGIGWSDQWSFWRHGYKAVMVTDTALFRYPYYHTPFDTPDKLDYERMARVVDGLAGVVSDLTGSSSPVQPRR